MCTNYDVIIVGAGIGSLVCGCYLAKAGERVLIIEKNSVVGGYCVSFKRNGYFFDAAAHSLGNCHKGNLATVLQELDLFDDLRLNQPEITDIIISQDFIFKVHRDAKIFLNDLCFIFKSEENNLKIFFSYLQETSLSKLYTDLKYKTFADLLNKFFKISGLKDILGVFCLNKGLSAEYLSAIAAVLLFRDFIFNGGFYPLGGMQSLPNSLLRKFKNLGGSVILSKKVVNLFIKNALVKEVVLENNESFCSEVVIVGCDMREMYEGIIGDEEFRVVKKKIYKMNISSSFFIIYLGLKTSIRHLFNNCSTLYFISKGERIKGKLMKLKKNINNFLLCSPTFHNPSLSKNGESLTILVPVPYVSKQFWNDISEELTYYLIQKVSHHVPGIERLIDFKSTTTPATLEVYTSNSSGAAFGWASTNEQLYQARLGFKTLFGNLFFCGHWTHSLSGYGGIQQVAYSGRTLAKYLLANKAGK